MLRTRLWMGALLILATVGVLVVDQWLAPTYPFLLLLVLGLSLAGCFELVNLLPQSLRPPGWLCHAGVLSIILANWPAHLWPLGRPLDDAWHWIALALAAVVLTAFLTAMARFRAPGQSVSHIALSIFVVAYLGFLPCFLVQLRWLTDTKDAGMPLERGIGAVVLAIFVPKVCDIGAYFTGRLLGRHKMTPVLSPKKTWEGFAGGMVAAGLCAFAINRGVRALPNDMMAVGFGLTVGLAGVLGDLAESLIKRDCQQKDASQAVPGFGGVLDVVDSIVFAAPVAYCWFL
jgi:phosphatidate cytidylyltransferase